MRKDASRPYRSFMKAVSWEFFSFFLTALIIYLFTGDFNFTARLTITCQGIKVFFFYAHERIWHQIRWGKDDLFTNR